MTYPTVILGGGGGGGGKAKLERFRVGSAMSPRGGCAFRRLTNGSSLATLVVDVASPLSATFGPRSHTTWTTCGSIVTGVHFCSSEDGAVAELDVESMALLRTARTFDSATGNVTSEMTSGSNFLTNTAALACP